MLETYLQAPEIEWLIVESGFIVSAGDLRWIDVALISSRVTRNVRVWAVTKFEGL